MVGAAEGMEAVDLLCSRNARPQKTLVGHAQWETKQTTLREERTNELGGIICSLVRWPHVDHMGALLQEETEKTRFTPTLFSTSLPSV